MTNTLLLSIAATGFGIAFFHAAIPTHWLPFVLAARAQRWSRGKTLTVTALAGGGHVLFTTALGVLVVVLGVSVNRWTGNVFPWIAGGILFAFGAYYVLRQWRGGGHGHVHFTSEHEHEDDHKRTHGHDHPHPHPHDNRLALPRSVAAERATVLGLLALLTFSPCEGFLPVYLSGVGYGWTGFALLSLALAGATLAGMLIFTWFALVGFERLRLEALERYESAMLGGLLCLLGVLVIVFES